MKGFVNKNCIEIDLFIEKKLCDTAPDITEFPALVRNSCFRINNSTILHHHIQVGVQPKQPQLYCTMILKLDWTEQVTLRGLV